MSPTTSEINRPLGLISLLRYSGLTGCVAALEVGCCGACSLWRSVIFFRLLALLALGIGNSSDYISSDEIGKSLGHSQILSSFLLFKTGAQALRQGLRAL